MAPEQVVVVRAGVAGLSCAQPCLTLLAGYGPEAPAPAWHACYPEGSQAPRWRYARADRGADLSAPLLLRLPGGARVGIAGELFSPGGGVEAGWLSGRMLAGQILAEGDG